MKMNTPNVFLLTLVQELKIIKLINFWTRLAANSWNSDGLLSDSNFSGGEFYIVAKIHASKWEA